MVEVSWKVEQIEKKLHTHTLLSLFICHPAFLIPINQMCVYLLL